MIGELDIRQDVPLAPLCSLELGGPARFLVSAPDEETVKNALQWAKKGEIQAVVVGGGTNLVVADEGFDGLVVLMRQQGTRVDRDGERVLLTAAAGQNWDTVVKQAVEEGWAGIECLSGIPGSAGATVVQNAGAYGQEIAETIEGVRVLARSDLRIDALQTPACGFGYRESAFKQDPGTGVVLSVTLGLKPGGDPALLYPELVKELGRTSAAPGLAEVREAVLGLRRSKSMLLRPDDDNRRSAGSFFLNPLLDAERAGEVIRRSIETGAVGRAEEIPQWKAGPDRVKLAAAWLIEKSGFARGHRSGRVGISSRHALALVHHGGGTTAELLGLARQMRDAVLDRFGVRLRPEPAFLGFAQPPL